MVAVLNLDALSVPRVERLVADGRMPVLGRLLSAAPRLPLDVAPAYMGARQTLYTGVELGGHGLYYAFQWHAPEQRLRYADYFERPSTVWERASAAGKRSLVVDPYEGWRPRPSHGICVSGVQLSNKVVLARWAEPEAAGRDLRRGLGRSPGVDEVPGTPTLAWLLELRNRLLKASERLADACELLLARTRYDLVWITFAACHIGGHGLWDASQLDARERATGLEALAGALDDVYAGVDSALGAVLEALPDETDLIVVSPVGMAENASRSDLLPAMLEAVLGRPLADAASPRRGWLWRLRAQLPPAVRTAIMDRLPDRAVFELTARLYYPRVDWFTTPVFSLPADWDGFVRLNLRGRERDGIVAPGDAEALLERVADGLETFRDEDGTPTVAGIDRPGDITPGPHAHRLPDVTVQWNDRPATQLQAVRSREFGEVRRGVGSGRSGNHVPGAWGLLLPGRARLRDVSRPPRLVDVTATAAALLGVPLEGLVGDPLLE